MKLYANNRLLAEHLLETAFAILRNEGQQPADVMALVYDLLTSGIDVTTIQQVALHDYLRRVLGDYDNQRLSVMHAEDTKEVGHVEETR